MAIKLQIFTLVAMSMILGSHQQMSTMGKCPAGLKGVANFVPKTFDGTWYEVKRYPSIQVLGKCFTLKYESQAKAANIKVSQLTPGTTSMVTEAYQKTLTSSWSYQMELGIGKSDCSSWNWNSIFQSVAANASTYILDTDYKNYFVMYSCATFFDSSKLEFAWIYSRNRNLTQTLLAKANDVFTKNKIDTTPLLMSDQSGCK